MIIPKKHLLLVLYWANFDPKLVQYWARSKCLLRSPTIMLNPTWIKSPPPIKPASVWCRINCGPMRATTAWPLINTLSHVFRSNSIQFEHIYPRYYKLGDKNTRAYRWRVGWARRIPCGFDFFRNYFGSNGGRDLLTHLLAEATSCR